jgi:hypothetical protein
VAVPSAFFRGHRSARKTGWNSKDSLFLKVGEAIQRARLEPYIFLSWLTLVEVRTLAIQYVLISHMPSNKATFTAPSQGTVAAEHQGILHEAITGLAQKLEIRSEERRARVYLVRK